MRTEKSESSLAESVKQKSKLIQTENGFAYRDLNKNGKLDIYEDPCQPIIARVEDLLAQMTLAEKAGMLFIYGVQVNPDGSIEEKTGEQAFTGFGGGVKTKVTNLQMNHFNVWQIPGARPLASWYNNVQQLAEQSRLGIPATLSPSQKESCHLSSLLLWKPSVPKGAMCRAIPKIRCTPLALG
jgi:beta-glucosidase